MTVLGSPAPLPQTPPIARRLPRIFHPTDLSPESHIAFYHALKMTLLMKGRLEMMHVDGGAGHTEWDAFPHVRETLARWGLLPPDAPHAAVGELGIRVEKILARDEKTFDALGTYLDHHPTDLMVLTTHQREGLFPWRAASVAEELARRAHVPTLFVPASAAGFVSPDDGSLSIRRLLIPIDHSPDPAHTVNAAVRFGEFLGHAALELHLLHVGRDMPPYEPVARSGWLWRTEVRHGDDPVEAIVSAADEIGADALVMATEGHQDFLDAVRGSTTERVLRRLSCPLFAVRVPGAE